MWDDPLTLSAGIKAKCRQSSGLPLRWNICVTVCMGVTQHLLWPFSLMVVLPFENYNRSLNCYHLSDEIKENRRRSTPNGSYEFWSFNADQAQCCAITVPWPGWTNQLNLTRAWRRQSLAKVSGVTGARTFHALFSRKDNPKWTSRLISTLSIWRHRQFGVEDRIFPTFFAACTKLLTTSRQSVARGMFEHASSQCWSKCPTRYADQPNHTLLRTL